MSTYLRSSDLAGARVLVVHAHPDDEVFATGAATVAAEHGGASVHLRVLTGGEGRGSGVTEADLAAARRSKERSLDRSTTLLGITDWAYVSGPGRWNDTPHSPERTVAAAPMEELAAAVRGIIDELRPDVLLTVGRDGLTGHPDHVACHAAVRQALVTTAHPPRLALGAVLDHGEVDGAHDAAQSCLGRPVGSGTVAGAATGSDVVLVAGPAGTDERRRRALDAYTPFLGTATYADLSVERVGSGDSVLLRFLLDRTGWDRDRFERLM